MKKIINYILQTNFLSSKYMFFICCILVSGLIYLDNKYNYKASKLEEKLPNNELNEACVKIDMRKSINYVNNYLLPFHNRKMEIDKKDLKIVKYWTALSMKESLYPEGTICSVYFNDKGLVINVTVEFL